MKKVCAGRLLCFQSNILHMVRATVTLRPQLLQLVVFAHVMNYLHLVWNDAVCKN